MWGFIVAAWNIISGAAQAVGHAVTAALVASVAAIWNVLHATGDLLSRFGKKTWSWLRDAWDKVHGKAIADIFRHPIDSLQKLWRHVLKPGFAKINKWIDRAHEWLQTKFGPILCWLQKARKYIEDFYKTYIKPILDIIDVSRAFLQILARLGVDWARALDRVLGEIEDWVTARLNEILARVNQVSDIIDRIVGLDGLYQRVVLLRSLIRDAKYTANIWWHSVHRNATEQEKEAAAAKVKRMSAPDHAKDLVHAIVTGDGETAKRIQEDALDLRLILRSL